VVFFYLEKAFGCLKHDIFMSKLQFYGVNGKAKLWFESYLNNACQRIQVLDVESSQTSLSTREKITDGILVYKLKVLILKIFKLTCLTLFIV
jgi:hypothetical protein